MTTNKAWKEAERKVARIIGGKRVPLSGCNNRFASGDVDHPDLFIEVKHGKQIPKTVTDWYNKTKDDEIIDYNKQLEYAKHNGGASRAPKIPILVMHPKGSSSMYAFIELRHLKKLIGEDHGKENQED